MLWSMLILPGSAPVTLQFRVEEPPVTICGALAVKVMSGPANGAMVKSAR
jgi:hypothetical protein